MTDIILHHYPQSPVAEKVRVVLGIKGLSWRSVEIPRLPPKPDLMPLTGGYRLTPVMQVGADVYCDSQCIIRELERRFPDPTLFPGGNSGLAWGLSRWTDGEVVELVIRLAIAAGPQEISAEFAADRGPLYFGDGFDIEALRKNVPETAARLRAHMGWMDDRLEDCRDFMDGGQAGLADVLCYYLVWFVRGRYGRGPELLGEFKALCRWEERMKAFGNGNQTAMEAAEALDIARDSEPQAAAESLPDDPQGISPGDTVEVTAAGVNGVAGVSGRVVGLSRDEIVLARKDKRVGATAVHFPRVGSKIVLV